jgi:zinc and cadmium transporter
VISLISLVGVFTLFFKDAMLKKILLILVGFSAGALMGGAFFHLIPEAMALAGIELVFVYVLTGFSSFFIIERFLNWHHCHDGKCSVHLFTHMSLIGDSIHNFIDGLVVASSFIVSVPFGIVTSIAIISHEIPQELGDFGVLVFGGFNKVKALMFNFFTALTAVAGALIGFFFSSMLEGFNSFLLPFAAGGFIYISASDLVPELHKEKKLDKAIISFVFFLLGIGFMLLVKMFLEK